MEIQEGVIRAIISRLKKGGTIYCIGNGGSASQSSHLVGELIGKFGKVRPPIRAVSLTDNAVITCIANDFGYDKIYSRQLEALLTEKDILIGFSTSGKSKNILEGMHVAERKKAYCVFVCGTHFGHISTYYAVVHSNKMNTDEIQEDHLNFIHSLVKEIEKLLYNI